MRTRILAMMGLGLLLAGCLGRHNQPPPAAQTASEICAGYGVLPATYSACVTYQESRAQASPNPSVPPYRLDQYNNRVDAAGYRVDSMGRRMAVQSPYDFR